MGPADLSSVLHGLTDAGDARVIVDARDSDDAAVVIVGTQTVLQTVDIITPVVSDPYLFGRIAAANALSDIWAMGGRPVSALNIAGFPVDCLDTTVLREILAGGAAAVREAGAVIAGGHTVIDTEVTYGLSVTGVPGNRIMRNNMARPGLDIILTKPAGGGLVSTALRAGMADPSHVKAMADGMARLNGNAAEAAMNGNAVTMTDVTGFGLAGHLLEVCLASGIAAVLEPDAIPFLPGVRDCFAQGLIPAGAYRNRDWAGGRIAMDGDRALLLSSPETSGGLLVFCPPGDTARLVDAIRGGGDAAAARIGSTCAVRTGMPVITA